MRRERSAGLIKVHSEGIVVFHVRRKKLEPNQKLEKHGALEAVNLSHK